MIRFKNGKIMTMEHGMEIIDGELWTDGEKVAYTGKTPETLPAFEREIDLQGNLVMPSFKNAHTHSAMTFLRSFAEDVPLQTWLFDKVFPYEARLTAEDVYAFDRLAILEYLASGTTAFFDMYFFPDSTVQAAIESGMRGILCGSVSGSAKDVERMVAQFEQFQSGNQHARIGYRVGFHAEYTSDESLHREIVKYAESKKEPVYLHLSETKSEHDECIARHGATPAQYLDSLGLWQYGGGVFHGVWLDETDRKVLKKSGVSVVSCPCSNAKLASGIAPVKELLAEGVNVGLGTDGAASNNGLDMFREMYFGAVLQKLRNMDAAAVPAAEFLKAATVGSARAMGLTDCDTLAVGKQADLIVIDLNAANLRPLHHIPESIVLSGGRQNVLLTMCAGKVLYENGEYVNGMNPAEIIAECEQRVARLTL